MYMVDAYIHQAYTHLFLIFKCNFLFVIVVPVVTPSRMFTTPFVTPTMIPEEPTVELADVAAAFGITFGGLVVTFLVCVCVFAVFEKCKK